MSLHIGCDLPRSGLSGGLRVTLVAEFRCKFLDSAELSVFASAIRGGVPWFLSLTCCQFVAFCCSLLSLPLIKDGLQQCGEGCGGKLVQVSGVTRASGTRFQFL